MIAFNLIPPAPTSLRDDIVPSRLSGLGPPSKSRKMRGPVPSLASIYPEKVELVCSYKPLADVHNDLETISNSPPLKSPLEPILRAVLQKHPNYDLSSLDLLASRTNLRKLFRLVSVSGARRKAPRELKFYVELIRPPHVQPGHCDVGDLAGTVLLSSGNLQEDDVDVTDDDAGDDHGAEFLEHHSEILSSDNKGKTCSTEDAKIVTYDLAGMRCMIKYPPTGKLPAAQEKGKQIQQEDEGSEKCWRVRKKTKIRVIDHVDEWRRKVRDGVSVACSAQPQPHHDEDGDAVQDNAPVTIAGNDAEVSKDVEAWRLEQLDQLGDLSSAMEGFGMHSGPKMENDTEIPQIKTTSVIEGRSNRQRGDSVSSTSSAHSQASSRSIVSSRSSVSWVPGESSHYYHYHKKLQLLPTIAPTPPNEPVSPTRFLGFDTPLSNLWYRANRASSFFDVEATEPAFDTEESDSAGKDVGCEVVGKYRSTAKYRTVLQTWEKEHVENLWKLVDVLRKIRKAAGKAGRCKVVVESSGKIRPYRVKKSQEGKEEEIGRVSILPPDLLAKWV